jgi:hypothetical protein
MDRTGRDPRIRPGIDVLGFDGRKVGTVAAVGADHLVVERGWLAVTRYRVPLAAVAGLEGGHVLLTVTRDQARARGWEAPPPR